MRKFGVIHAGFWCCAGLCLLGGACSSDDDDGGGAGSGGVAGAPNGGRVGGGTPGTAGEGNAGAGEAGSGGRPEGGMGGGGRGDACDEEVTNDFIQRTLTEYCQDHDCPESLEAARENVFECGELESSEERTGCGYTVVSSYGDLFGRGFVFEGTELVGAYSFDDVIEPPCDTVGEVGGLYPPVCTDDESCFFCDNEDGSGGVGPFCEVGVGGSSGEGN